MTSITDAAKPDLKEILNEADKYKKRKTIHGRHLKHFIRQEKF